MFASIRRFVIGRGESSGRGGRTGRKLRVEALDGRLLLTANPILHAPHYIIPIVGGGHYQVPAPPVLHTGELGPRRI